jgi:hypothetical protein
MKICCFKTFGCILLIDRSGDLNEFAFDRLQTTNDRNIQLAITIDTQKTGYFV